MTRAASDRPARAGHPTFADAAPRLLEGGYEPLPIRPGQKRPAPREWSSGPIDDDRIAKWCREFTHCGIGLRTGHLVAIDIDILNEDVAHEAEQRVRAALGDTPLLRVGLWPKRLLLFRAEQSFRKLSSGGIEVLGDGQQLVAFGIHPETGGPYYWPSFETPFDVPRCELPRVDETMCRALLGVQRSSPKQPRSSPPRATPPAPGSRGPFGPVRDERGLVVDGRDGWLSQVAFHAVHDAMDAGRPLDGGTLARETWARFESTADLGRGRGNGGCAYRPVDAERKVGNKLRLHHEGRLPPRATHGPEPFCEAPTLSADEARAVLDRMLGDACRAIEDWYETPKGPAPQIGIRATVGLGKSIRARSHVLALRDSLRQQEKPSRIAVVTPSHALAEEAAAGWQESDLQVAVLRGYHATDPASGQPLCRDTDAVDIAIRAGVEVAESACRNRTGETCPYLDGCLKQKNVHDVAAADVVIAPYDTLYTGFSGDMTSIGVVIADEACWPRAMQEERLPLDDLLLGTATSPRPRAGADPDAEMADLHALRAKLRDALHVEEDEEDQVVSRSGLSAAGLTEEACRLAAKLEERLVRNPKLRPGMSSARRRKPRQTADANVRARVFVALWRAAAELLAGSAERNGRLFLDERNGRQHVVVRGVKSLHVDLVGKPVLHLDATLRPDLAKTVLPHLRNEEVDAAAPHMRVTLVPGSFGKGMLCPMPGLSPEEAKRRANRRRECVDYVRWQASRVAPGRVLAITYKSIEEDFAGIPNVSVAHFNAIAGLDVYRDVRSLVVIGRPLPSTHDVSKLVGAYLSHASEGGYRKVTRGVRMRDGRGQAVEVIEHSDASGELLRAAVCDDELVQAIGRGRGVNRTAETPLDIHILADVALPLVHDRVLQWEAVKPDIVQRMLLAGVAVNSPTDAALLHSDIFDNSNQARLCFARAGFSGQTPIRDPYREMTVKSAAYRRAGRGRSWQRVWWSGASADEVRQRLEAVLCDLAGWKPE